MTQGAKITLALATASVLVVLLFIYNEKTGDIMSGKYRNSGKIAGISLSDAAAEKRESGLVPYTKCGFKSDETPARSPLIINEVAWMGTKTAAAHEWVELKNISNGQINASGWQLLNANEKIHIIFPQQLLLNSGQLLVAARSGANTALKLNTKIIFSGSLRNNGEGLRLFDNKCRLIDEVPASPNWPAGNSASKQTMERFSNLSWGNSAAVGGTPGTANSPLVPKTKPSVAKKTQTQPASTKPQTSSSLDAPCINLNTASKTDLMKIRHIGSSRADQIISRRPFTNVNELKGKVSGIGDQRLTDIINEDKACAP